MIALILILLLLTALVSYPPLIKGKKRYEIGVLSVFFLLAFTLSILQILDIPIPSPIKMIQAFMKDVLHLYFR